MLLKLFIYTGNFGDLVMKNSKVFNAILNNKEEKRNVSRFSQLHVINFSEVGSNKKSEEDKTIYSFEVSLQDLEEGDVVDLKLEDLLIFITGADKVPHLDFLT